MFIQTEPTPNPATLKFLPGRPVLTSGTLDMRDKEAAAQSPLAERLFEIAGISGVFFGSDFVAVTKSSTGGAGANVILDMVGGDYIERNYEAAAVEENAWPLLAAGKIAPVMDHAFPLTQADKAHARLESSAHIGKIVLTV